MWTEFTQCNAQGLSPVMVHHGRGKVVSHKLNTNQEGLGIEVHVGAPVGSNTKSQIIQREICSFVSFNQTISEMYIRLRFMVTFFP